jgi:hypothetical protein
MIQLKEKTKIERKTLQLQLEIILEVYGTIVYPNLKQQNIRFRQNLT